MVLFKVDIFSEYCSIKVSIVFILSMYAKLKQ